MLIPKLLLGDEHSDARTRMLIPKRPSPSIIVLLLPINSSILPIITSIITYFYIIIARSSIRVRASESEHYSSIITY